MKLCLGSMLALSQEKKMVISHETNRSGRDFETGQKTSFLLKAAMPPELWFYTCPQVAGVKQRTRADTGEVEVPAQGLPQPLRRTASSAWPRVSHPPVRMRGTVPAAEWWPGAAKFLPDEWESWEARCEWQET